MIQLLTFALGFIVSKLWERWKYYKKNRRTFTELVMQYNNKLNAWCVNNLKNSLKKLETNEFKVNLTDKDYE